MGRKALLPFPVIVPNLCWVKAFLVVETFDAHRRAQDDIEPPHIGHPTFAWRTPPVVLIGIIESFDMFLSVFIHRCSGSWIPLLPKGLDKNISLSIVGKLQKNVFFFWLDDVAHQF